MNVRVPFARCTRFELPAVCVVTGQTDDVEFFEVSFAAGTKGERTLVTLPFTKRAHARWRFAERIFPVVVTLVAIAELVAASLLGYRRDPNHFDSTPELRLGIGAVAFTYFAMLAVVRRLGPSCEEIVDDSVVLRLPSKTAAAAFVERITRPASAATGPAVCSSHRVASTFVCARCGDFGCPECHREARTGAALCAACAARTGGALNEEDRKRRVLRARIAFALGIPGLCLLFPLAVMALVQGIRSMREISRAQDDAGWGTALFAAILGAVGLGVFATFMAFTL